MLYCLAAIVSLNTANGADTYAQGEKGVDTCPSGYAPIYNTAECEDAANHFGYPYDANDGDKTGTILCNYCTGCNPIQVELSSSHGNEAYWLCKKELCVHTNIKENIRGKWKYTLGDLGSEGYYCGFDSGNYGGVEFEDNDCDTSMDNDDFVNNQMCCECGGGEKQLDVCWDGTQNQDETGIDCGGSCSACGSYTGYIDECESCSECLWTADSSGVQSGLSGGGHTQENCNYASYSTSGYCHLSQHCYEKGSTESWSR